MALLKSLILESESLFYMLNLSKLILAANREVWVIYYLFIFEANNDVVDLAVINSFGGSEDFLLIWLVFTGIV